MGVFSRPTNPKTADEVATAIIDKIFTTSKVRHNEAQLQSNEHMIKYAFSKVIETNKICSARVGNELILFQFDKVFADKPFQIETNGIRHNLTVNECLDREGSYVSPFYLSLSIWVFSKQDPRSIEKRLELIKRIKSILRMKSKAKRIRVEQFEMSAVQTLERKRARTMQNKRRKQQAADADAEMDTDALAEEGKEFKYTIEDREDTLEDGEYDEEEMLKSLTDEDFEALYDDSDPRYLKKLHDAYDQARMAPYERTDYPFLISHVCFPKHTLIEIPVMLDSSLCHVSDEITGMMNDIYSTSGGFVFKGKKRPFMRTNYCRFSHNMMLTQDGDIENRSAHSTSAQRNSSSTLTCCLQKQNQQKFKNQFLEWKIPYCYDFKVPWYVLFAGCGLMDKEQIVELVQFEMRHYFRKWKDIPMEKVMELLQNSLEHNARGSETIKTQEEAWLYIGKLTEKADDPDFAVDLIATPDEERKVPKISKRKRKFATLNAIVEASNPDRETLEEEGKLEGPVIPIYKPYVPKDPNKDWIRIGRQTICKEILPHVGSDIRHDADHWKTKAMHLVRMSAKRLIARAATFTPNPEKFILKDNRDGVENRRIQLVSQWVMNQLVKGVVTSHIKMARLEWIAAIHSGNQPEPKTSLDHQRPTNLVMTAFGTGIFKSRIMPALIASQAKAGKKTFQAPDAHRRPNNNNSSKAAKDRTGITQVQNNTNLFATWSQQVRINGNLQSTGGATSSAREILDDFGKSLKTS